MRSKVLLSTIRSNTTCADNTFDTIKLVSDCFDELENQLIPLEQENKRLSQIADLNQKIIDAYEKTFNFYQNILIELRKFAHVHDTHILFDKVSCYETPAYKLLKEALKNGKTN